MRMVVGVHRLHCYPNQWKISGHHLRAATGNSEYCTMVASYQLSISPQNMVLVTTHQENRFKGPTETEPHWTHTLQLTTKVKYLGLILDKGLKHWIHTTVIRPVLTHGSMVCGQVSDMKSAMMSSGSSRN
jgi:hypothetical protein